MQTHPLPSLRRVVTGHDHRGKAVVTTDDLITGDTVAPGANIALLWTTGAVPADNNDPTDGRDRDAGLTIKSGSVVRTVDFLPGAESPFHRTNSIDYGIVIAGEIELELEDGIKTVVGPHSVVVQRGTHHKWRNPSDVEPARVIFVLIEAAAYVHEGQPLPPHGL